MRTKHEASRCEASDLDWERDTRLAEARAAFAQQYRIARWNRWAVEALIFGQFIVGGLLTAPLVQQALTATQVGLLGLLVLVCSLIYARYRPDIRASRSSARAARVLQLLNEAEDAVFEMKGRGDPAHIGTIRRRITQGLVEVAQAELEESKALQKAISPEGDHP